MLTYIPKLDQERNVFLSERTTFFLLFYRLYLAYYLAITGVSTVEWPGADGGRNSYKFHAESLVRHKYTVQ